MWQLEVRVPVAMAYQALEIEIRTVCKGYVAGVPLVSLCVRKCGIAG